MLVNISPEHARLATLANKQIAFIVWSALRDDIRANTTSGHYNKTDVKKICRALGYTTRHWTRIFESGHAIFWGNDDKKIHMRSYKRATRALEKLTKSYIDVRESFQLLVQIEVTRQDTTQSLYAKLYWAWFVARGEVTISRDAIQETFGLSHDQQRAYENILGKKILIKSNYCLVDSDDYRDDPEMLPDHARTFGYERLTASQKVVSVQAIQYQLPNTFIARCAGNGQETTTTAPQSLRKANMARLWFASYPHKQDRTYFAQWHQFERFGTENSYIRTYFNGKRRIWRRGQYL